MRDDGTPSMRCCALSALDNLACFGLASSGLFLFLLASEADVGAILLALILYLPLTPSPCMASTSHRRMWRHVLFDIAMGEKISKCK